MSRHILALAAITVVVAGAAGQNRFIINDRTMDAMWVVHDLNNNGQIGEPDELHRWFDASNAAGTPGPQNPTCLGIRHDGLVVMGDQLVVAIYFFRDLNNDGDALDAAESRIAADSSNGSGAALTFPSGVAFDSEGTVYVCNAGTASGPDVIWKLQDLNGDGDMQDPGEITPYVGEPFFGPGNGPYSPQEIAIDANDVMYLRNSASGGLSGVYRFEDLDGNGRADDPGEATTFFDSTNASGINVTAGFALELDAVRARSMYLIQTRSAVDELIRLTDFNGDNDAQDVDEALIVYSTGEANFSPIDVVSLRDGRVLLTDNSGKKVYVFTDTDGDGRFMSPGERATYFFNSGSLVGDVRQMSLLPIPGDLNCDGVVNAFDIDPFVLALTSTPPNYPEYYAVYPGCDALLADANGDGVLNAFDIDPFVTLLTGY